MAKRSWWMEVILLSILRLPDILQLLLFLAWLRVGTPMRMKVYVQYSNTQNLGLPASAGAQAKISLNFSDVGRVCYMRSKWGSLGYTVYHIVAPPMVDPFE